MTESDLRSAGDLVAFALAMERQAARRYHQLAEAMDAHGNHETAAVFRELAVEEQLHAEHIEVHFAKAKERSSSPPTTPLAEADPKDVDDAGGPYLITPYRALRVAVQNEERAFAIYTRIAAETDEPELQACAEDLAREELEHVLRLRLERRRAFRAEAKVGPLRLAELDALPPDRAVMVTAHRLRAWLDAAAHRLAALGDAVAATTLSSLSDATRASAGTPAEPDEVLPPPEVAALSAYDTLRQVLRALDEGLDSLATTAGKAETAVVDAAEKTSEVLIAGLEAVRAELDRVVATKGTREPL